MRKNFWTAVDLPEVRPFQYQRGIAMGDEISMLVYQVSVARSAEMNLSNHFPEKREIGFGRNHADDTLRSGPKVESPA